MIEIVKRPSENNNVEAENAVKVQVAPKPVDPSNLIGQVFGDYVVTSLSGRDSSGHKLWTCVCPICGDTFKTTSYELIKGRKKTVCKKCAEEKLLEQQDHAFFTALGFCDDDFKKMKNNEVKNNEVKNNDESKHTSILKCGERSCEGCCTYCCEECYNGTSPVTVNDCFEDDYSKDDYDCYRNCDDGCEDRENFTLGNNTVVFLNKTSRGYSEEFYSHIADGVFVRELKQDLLEMPVYYSIAHCLPADLTVYGETAKRIDEAFDLVEHILSDLGPEEEISVGDILGFGNVFTLIPNPKARTRPSLNDLREAVKTLAVACAKEQVMYLAMPRIGCGHNGLNWNEVKLMICEEFAKAYRPHCESNYFKPIKITFCYLD